MFISLKKGETIWSLLKLHLTASTVVPKNIGFPLMQKKKVNKQQHWLDFKCKSASS